VTARILDGTDPGRRGGGQERHRPDHGGDGPARRYGGGRRRRPDDRGHAADHRGGTCGVAQLAL